MLIFNDPRPYSLDISALRTTNNIPKTRQLFYELSKGKKFNSPVFTLDNAFDLYYSSTDKYPEFYYWSLRRLYLEAEDPHEYTFAMNTFGSWDHWQRIVNATWFEPYITDWRDELSTKLASKGVKGLLDKASSGDVVANKFLASREWHKLHSRLNTKDKDSADTKEINDDFERLKQLKAPLRVVK